MSYQACLRDKPRDQILPFRPLRSTCLQQSKNRTSNKSVRIFFPFHQEFHEVIQLLPKYSRRNATQHTLMPRLILHTSCPSGITDAVVTSAPKRVSVSVMHVVSISSDPSAIGTSTRLDILRAEDVRARSVVVCGGDEKKKPCDPLPNARTAAKTIRIAITRGF